MQHWLCTGCRLHRHPPEFRVADHVAGGDVGGGGYRAGVKQVVKVRMLPTAAQAAALQATVITCNAAASWLSGRMHGERVHHKHAAQKRFYTELKERFGLSAQPAIRVISKVADAYATLKANIDAGNYGPPSSAVTPIKTDPVSAGAAQPFDARACRGRFLRASDETRGCRSGQLMVGLKVSGLPERHGIWSCCAPARSERPTSSPGMASGSYTPRSRFRKPRWQIVNAASMSIGDRNIITTRTATPLGTSQWIPAKSRRGHVAGKKTCSARRSLEAPP